MAATRLSSKGQLVIPRMIREQLGILPGACFKVETEGDRIILTPAITTVRQKLYGKFREETLLEDLEQEHAEEIRSEMGT